MTHYILYRKYIALEIDTMHWSLGIKILEINPYNDGWCVGLSLLCFHLHIGLL